jgi:hypothetical protein
MVTLPNSVARLWPLWLEGRCQSSNVKITAGDLFATPNLLKSHAERTYFPHIATSVPLCARPRLAIVPDHCLDFFIA